MKLTSRNIIQTIALFLLLIGFPAMSWYYLRTGLDYRVEALGELGDLGKIPAFELTNYNGKQLANAALQGKVVVANFMSTAESENTNLKGKYLQKLHHQFNERKDVVFVNYLLEEPDDTTGKTVASFAEEFSLLDPDQCYFLSGASAGMEQLAKEGFHLPLTAEMSLQNNPFLILADTSQTIRKVYDVREPQQIARLVEHIALIIPLQTKRKADVVEE